MLKKIGEGGNSVVLTDEKFAYKRLKAGLSSEAVARFRREAELLMDLHGSSTLRIVAAHEIREHDGCIEIVMDRLSGSLEQVVERFQGQPRKAARALAPIAETLAELSARTPAIHHRDIKPSNLLFGSNEDELLLADFGCAFVAGDERLTPDKRAMGAWAYRPPEYSNGRVAEVNEKGDVFSLGKVFWAMIFGEKGYVFPGTIWFTPEFNLGAIFPQAPGINHAMLVISQACGVDPGRRPTFVQLAESLWRTADENVGPGDRAAVEMLRAEAVVDAEHAQLRAATATFVRALHGDLHAAIASLHGSNPDFMMWSEWSKDANRTHQTADALELQVAERGSDAPVVNSRFRGRHLVTRFYPAIRDTPARFSATIGIDSVSSLILRVENKPTGLLFETSQVDFMPSSGVYSYEVLLQFLERASRQVYGLGQ